MSAIDKVIQIAKNEIGYLEKKSKSNLYDKTTNAGSNNFTKYWEDIKPDYQGQPWCAVFVTWCFVQAFGKDNARKLLGHYPYVYCPTLASLFTRYANPQRGDIVVFYRGGEFCHTGIVTAVNGDYFTTIEGNTSGGSSIISNGGGVCSKGYYNSSLPGTKFIRPDYSIVASEGFKDVSGHYAEQHIQKLVDYGIVSGYEDGTFRPDAHITRAEFAALAVKTLEKGCGYSLKTAPHFSDMAGHWAESAVSKLSACGIVNGYEDGTFKPDEYIQRGQAAIIASNLLSYCGIGMKSGDNFPDTLGHYAERHIASLRSFGVINGMDDGLFHPDDEITRGQAAIYISNCLTVLGK